MSYTVVLPAFEGPMDLLLHLIDEHELDIYDIPIAFITGQYMDYLKKADEVDLNLSGEFLVMAGTLLLIKAQMLLPKRPQEEGEAEAAPDPREELIEKLLAYRIFKENAQELKKMETSQTKVYYREIDERRLFALFPQPNPVGDLTPEDLHGAFREILRLMRARERVITVPKERMSVNDRIAFLTDVLSRHPGGVHFGRLWEDCGDLLEAGTPLLALRDRMGKGGAWGRRGEWFGDIFVSAIRPAEEGEAVR
ncbi:MAG: segregation/condensation protein A [Syntrophorhabdaceae bacterium]|nr:segregation/condensation protein A [Syntrophorhabdaceae bacterium]